MKITFPQAPAATRGRSQLNLETKINQLPRCKQRDNAVKRFSLCFRFNM